VSVTNSSRKEETQYFSRFSEIYKLIYVADFCRVRIIFNISDNLRILQHFVEVIVNVFCRYFEQIQKKSELQ